ncbi:CLUMA_CG018937, isoform A [Clunio marinus]|uniref:Protein FAM50 homolog n=1 Tax=Clunio marinus TaxID=568069 RepID=A0A1J1J0N9_9DIPT|nr:CLUMA_CG018937, isoform A [Clunio marinus]
MAHYKGAASEAGRAMQLLKKRELQQQETELRKKKIEEDLKVQNIDSKFASHFDAVEMQLKADTVGLVTLDQMKAKQEIIVKEREKKLAQKEKEKNKEQMKALEAKEAEKSKQRRQIQTLSFNIEEDELDDDEDGDSSSDKKQPKWSEQTEPVKKKIKKNPNVDTTFLPDREREEAENKLREELRQQWVEKQAALKDEEIEITFSYWDGSGHRRSIIQKKGNSIYQFLQKALEEVLRKEFPELKAVSADQLMYVKEDLILPQHYTFYDFIITKARGKSGPLFQFDVKDDIRMISDATVEKEESHAGKVLLRSWYEKSKHIFPASRWEPFDPTKSYDKYTYKDKKKN